MLPHLALVILAVDDIARATAFYRSILGWKVMVQVPTYVELAGPDGIRLGLYDAVGFARNIGESPAAAPPGNIGRTELYLRCEDPEAALTAAVGAGARLLSPVSAREWGDLAGYVADPEGNVIAFARPSS